MDEKTMKEKMAEAKKIYYERDFRSYMRKMQGFTDEDFEKVVPLIKEKVIKAVEKNPYEIFQRVLKEIASQWNKKIFPVHADWHHYLVPGVILSAMRNCGYDINDKDIEEAMYRGENFPGGSCGFAGTCGGAFSVGIVMSIVNKTTPLHVDERAESMEAVIETLKKVKKYPARCCKRSSYIALETAVEFLKEKGFDKIEIGKIECIWSSGNKACLGVKCPYFKKDSQD
ncbi:MAG: DUF5714 domain-containing protein [Candidatus Omnitrophica bacterium]|nr:DUF5714 domain-containing protein [Candidatus Omnitrophota bacterium]MCM8822659.1 DUF5714 domain-containing protein [Candidatus Omnitrophota bacterium]MCM8827834.1 DUF5714 domain-containing protein [Candidatus Omnitrophota bacterium]